MTPLATALPENSHDGYVAAAYIVFFALLLIYVAVMAVRVSRMERRLRTLKGNPHDGGQASEPHERHDAEAGAEAMERELA